MKEECSSLKATVMGLEDTKLQLETHLKDAYITIENLKIEVMLYVFLLATFGSERKSFAFFW